MGLLCAGGLFFAGRRHPSAAHRPGTAACGEDRASLRQDILSGNARDTRTAFELESTKLTFKWAEGDRIGIFPLGVEGQNDQVSLTIHSGAGSNQATFSGGGWALRTDMTYAAYYPYQLSSAEQAVTDTEILFSYEHQCQTGNATLTHLGKHDFMATVGTVAANRSQGTEAPEDWVLNFDFFHMNCVAQLNLVLPKAVAVEKKLALPSRTRRLPYT